MAKKKPAPSAPVVVDTLSAENAALRAKLAELIPSPAPIIEYPKWITRAEKNGAIQRLIVNDADEHDRLKLDGWS